MFHAPASRERIEGGVGAAKGALLPSPVSTSQFGRRSRVVLRLTRMSNGGLAHRLSFIVPGKCAFPSHTRLFSMYDD